MSIAGIGNGVPGSTALTLLRQSGEVGHGGGSKPGEAVSLSARPAVVYGGNLSRDGLSPFDAIRNILSANAAKGARPASDLGVAGLQDALERFAAADMDFNIEVDGQQFPAASAMALGDENIGHIVRYANQLITSDEEAMVKFGEMSKASASRPGASEFGKAIYQAFLAGDVELIPAREFGIETQQSNTFHFSARGEFLGSSGSQDNKQGDVSVGELYETRFIPQDDGTRTDIETGRYAAYVDVGGRDYIMMFDRPAA